jgi:hypothetical protein
MARNLARAPEKASALDFLEQARDLRRSAVQSLQAGLQPAEQRQAEGKAPFTLRETLQRRREAERVAEMTGLIDAAVQEQGRLQQRLSQAVQAVRETIRETVKGAAPLLRQAAEALRERQALNAVRVQLLDHRMGEWRREQRQKPTTETEQAAQARISHEIRVMPKADLHRAAAEWRRAQETKQERAAQRQRSGPSMSR